MLHGPKSQDIQALKSITQKCIVKDILDAVDDLHGHDPDPLQPRQDGMQDISHNF